MYICLKDRNYTQVEIKQTKPIQNKPMHALLYSKIDK